MSLVAGQNGLTERMERARQRFDALYARLARGELAQEDFEAARQELVVTDEQGGYWAPDAEGRWLWYDGAQWVQRAAPAQEAASPPEGAAHWRERGGAPREVATPPKAPLGRVLALAALFLVALAGGVVALALSVPDLEPKVVQLAQPLEGNTARYQLSPEQEDLIQRYGDPDGFIILFYEEEGASRPTRQETWAWHEAGVSISMIDGVPTGSIGLPPSEAVYASPYRPDHFAADMTLEQVLQAAQVTEYLVAPLEKELVPDAESYFADQLAFGLKDGRLLYIEGIALTYAED